MTLKSKLESIYIVVSTIATMGLGIYSVILAFDSAGLLIKLKDDLTVINRVQDNWKSKPIIDVKIVSYLSTCQSGYTAVTTPSSFGYIDKGVCACSKPISGQSVSYTSNNLANCSDVAEATSQCMSDPVQPGILLNYWR